MQYHLSIISAAAYIQKLGLVALAGENIKIFNLKKDKEQQEIKTEKYIKIFQLIFNQQDSNLYQFNLNKTIVKYRLKGRMFVLDKQLQLDYEFFPTLATVTHDNKTIIIGGMHSNILVFYNMVNECCFKLELSDSEIQNYCLLKNPENRFILSYNCLINVENKKVIRKVNTYSSEIKSWSQSGHFYSKEQEYKILITSAFKNKILRTFSVDRNNIYINQIFSETGKYYCLQKQCEVIQLYDISTGIDSQNQLKVYGLLQQFIIQ
ncbi:unnamed protein product (macronuclear) [Paramecium tetraurelia]|uniref:Anaphase-promoting complex subunit 4 WD40 domain-containing protein n=1 Tax=Paramecium tetraurelia TaxID=5888 RepID=A0E5W5_PARTE|nr:uncharacterized protein GSPATT00003545001 [Paramecium tetraurelia]CAK90682.1 unnamed protein product [Paramecium tetraurelia]|eukprot:XP_001458079.1 hypothetical protein (macronuclear) [Paramecium tetraurelia strain d4-2]